MNHGYKTFESMTICISSNDTSISLTIVYRPPPNKHNGYTTPEFRDKIESLAADLCSSSTHDVIIVGDFNVHFRKATDCNYLAFDQVLQSMDLTQLVEEATHSSGNVLDLVIARKPHNIFV